MLLIYFSQNVVFAYLVPERKPRNMVFQFYSKISNPMKLLSFLNPKSAIRNPKSCLNGVFVQARFWGNISLDQKVSVRRLCGVITYQAYF